MICTSFVDQSISFSPQDLCYCSCLECLDVIFAHNTFLDCFINTPLVLHWYHVHSPPQYYYTKSHVTAHPQEPPCYTIFMARKRGSSTQHHAHDCKKSTSSTPGSSGSVRMRQGSLYRTSGNTYKSIGTPSCSASWACLLIGDGDIMRVGTSIRLDALRLRRLLSRTRFQGLTSKALSTSSSDAPRVSG